jgi:hypothetical protein
MKFKQLIEQREVKESYDDYHGDMSKDDYDKTVKSSEMEYTVWVGGTEVNDTWLSYDDAVRLYDKYKAQGYDDVQLDARIKESYSPGDEYTDSEGMVSNCCMDTVDVQIVKTWQPVKLKKNTMKVGMVLKVQLKKVLMLSDTVGLSLVKKELNSLVTLESHSL